MTPDISEWRIPNEQCHERKSDSVRHLQSFTDTMARYHGDIERLVYASEILCPSPDRGSICHHKEHLCPWKSKMFANGELDVCRLRSIRVLIGDHVTQDDATEVKG